MDAMRNLHFTLFAVLLCCQYGVSYRIYILPEPGAFCLGVFSGDDCITWSDYSVHPKFADHSTTLIFTPGVYRYSRYYSRLSVPSIKRFTIIGDGAELQFPLTFSNIGEVRMHNLTFTNNPTINVRNVQTFMMENCNLSQAPGSTYSYYPRVGIVYIFNSNLSRIINSTFISSNRVTIDVRSSSNLVVEISTFKNSSQATSIEGDASSSVTIHSSRFFNNYASSYGVVYTHGPLEIVDCLFDGNAVSESAIVYSVEDVTVRDSKFLRNSASYLSYYSRYNSQYYTRYARGGSAIRGQRNINIYNCTFSLFTQTSAVINAYRHNNHYYDYYHDDQEGLYQLYITDSKFYHSSRSILSYNHVTIVDSSFSDITSISGAGGVVYSTKPITITNSTFTNSTAVYGDGGVIYSQQWISIVDSILINGLSNGNGGCIYSGSDVMANNCTISECSALNGTGGAIYSAAIEAKDLNATFEPNIILSRSTFSHNTAERGGVLYTSGHYDHHMEFTDSTFIFNKASGTNTTGGGVGCFGNTTLSIENCIFNNNVAESVGGVLDLSYSSVTIEHSSFSQNNADDNGGVFHGQNYSTNFTIAHTTMDRNSAGNGGVFYIRRSNSNINIYSDSKLISNSAGNQGGAIDIRGVTLTMDMDTVIANNTAGSSGNVISACVSQITIYGLEAQLDPVYPQYCLIYDEGNSSIPHPMSQTISTDGGTTILFTTEQTLIATTSHDGTTHELVLTTVSERGTTNKETITMSQTFSPMSQSTSATTFTSDSPGASHTHRPYEATSGPPSGTTSQLPSNNVATMTESNIQPPKMIASTKTVSHTDEVMTISVDVTTPGSEISASPTDPDRFAVLQGEEDKYDDVWKSSQHSQLQVSIISLMVLCVVCTVVCVMMITLFLIACKRRRGPRLVTRARYKNLPPTDKDLEDENEYSFSEI